MICWLGGEGKSMDCVVVVLIHGACTAVTGGSCWESGVKEGCSCRGIGSEGRVGGCRVAEVLGESKCGHKYSLGSVTEIHYSTGQTVSLDIMNPTTANKCYFTVRFISNTNSNEHLQ